MRKLGIVEWAEERGNVILEHFLPLRAIDWRPVLDIEEAKIAAMEVSGFVMAASPAGIGEAVIKAIADFRG